MPAMKKISEQNSSREIFNKMMSELELGSSPVDFELPNWLKKRKHFDYSVIRRNIYLTKRVKKRIEDDGIFCSCSPSPGSSSVCGRDCQCGMLLSSCSTSCKCGNSCLNKPFQQRKVRKLKLVQTERCGSGLVADEDIKRGEFVIEYVGEVIDDKTCEERLWKMKHRGETNFYLCEINRDMVIDATFKGNKSRFINHSCQPNTEMQKWRIEGETRIGIFATRDIMKGEDLTYDYQFVQFGADQDCHCGALGCRRKLGTKPTNLKRSSSDSSFKQDDQEEKDYSNGPLDKGRISNRSSHQRESHIRNCIGEFVRIWRPSEQRFIIGCIKHFNRSSREHTVLGEDRSEIVLDMSKEDWDFF